MHINIFLEGIADIKFISDLIQYKFGKKLNKNQIIDLNGWNGIENEKQKFLENSVDGGINIVILDADDDSNNGGFIKRRNEIEELKTRLGIKFELFLFPNNKEDGDLESLLSTIINKSNAPIMDCWNSFEECISSVGKGYTIPARKTKIYAYLEVLLGKTKKDKEMIKDKSRDFLNKDHWDLQHEFLHPLKEFLAPFFEK
jgi:hypothetical protein